MLLIRLFPPARPDSSTLSALTMNTLSPDARTKSLRRGEGEMCAQKPRSGLKTSLSGRAVHPRQSRFAACGLLRSCSLPHIRSQKFIQSPYTRSGSLQSNSIRNGSGGPFSAYPRTLPAGTTADRILRIIVRPVASRHHADSSEPGKSRPRCREHGRRALHFVELEKSARVLAPPAGRRKSPQAAGLISKEPEAPQ